MLSLRQFLPLFGERLTFRFVAANAHMGARLAWLLAFLSSSFVCWLLFELIVF
jgi:hypothetical protein